MLGGELQGVDRAQHFLPVAAGAHRVDEDQLDLLVRTDHEDIADSLVVRRRPLADVARGAGREHAVELGDVEIDVSDQRIVRRDALRLLDVLGPQMMLVGRVDADADQLDAALVELRLEPRDGAKLGRADRRKVFRVRKEKPPAVAEPFVKADVAFGALGFEVRRRRTNR